MLALSTVGLVIVVVLLLMVLGTLPVYPHSKSWGPFPSGILGVILLVLIVLLLMGRI